MQIEPQVTLPLIYKITDPLDATVYFIRAVIYDSLSGVQIDAKNLTSQGGGLYSSSIYAPKDPTGLGRHIHVIISVYTDSGYTTFSDTYQQIVDKYLIKHVGSTFGGGGGVDIDYDRIDILIDSRLRKLLQALLKALKEAKADPVDLGPVQAEIRALSASIIEAGEREVAEDSKTLIGLQDALVGFATQISGEIEDAKPAPVEPVDLAPVMAGLEGLKSIVNQLTTLSESSKKEFITQIEKLIPEAMEKASEDRKRAIETIRNELVEVAGPADKPEEKVAEPEVSPYVRKFFPTPKK